MRDKIFLQGIMLGTQCLALGIVVAITAVSVVYDIKQCCKKETPPKPTFNL